MQEYEDLGHMSPVESFVSIDEKGFYLPHHSVLKKSSLTTKLRVVFNAFAKTNTNLSLNDVLKVIAFICGLIVIILMIMGLASTDWLMADGWRQGLFMYCIADDAEQPLPFNVQETPGCYPSRDRDYIHAAAGLCIITLITDLVATILTGLGLRTKEHHAKYKYYRFGVIVMGLSLVSILIALIIYPVCFAAELNLGNRKIWEFGWAYGVGWGAAIFLFGGVVLLLCDKESEEIYYKERKIVHDNDSRA